MNSTETPGGSGIPAGWYDDPSGTGLRWWDGEQWTEHVHSAESAAAAGASSAAGGGGGGSGSREGAPPRDLVKLRESIRRRGTKSVGMVLGGIVVVLVVIGLLVAGGSDGGGSGKLHLGQPGSGLTGSPDPSAAATRRIRQINLQLKDEDLSSAKRKQLLAQKRRLQRGAGEAVQKQVEAAKKAAEEALENGE